MEMDIYGFIMLEKDFKKYDNIVYWVGNQHNEIIKQVPNHLQPDDMEF